MNDDGNERNGMLKVGTKVKFDLNEGVVIVGTIDNEGHVWCTVKEDYAASIWGESEMGKGTRHIVEVERLSAVTAS